MLATVLTQVKIDVSPDGVKFTLEGLDTDLATLIQAAGTFEVQPIEVHTFDTSDVVIRSTKVITFTDRPAI